MPEWDERADEMVRKRYIAENLPAAAVAEVIGGGVTAAAVRARALRLKAKRPPGPGAKAPEPKPANDPTWKPGPVQPVGPNSAVIADLRRHQCKWPVGKDPGEGRMHLQLFCGEAAQGNYCPNHDVL